jgi:hypothetical protein
MKELRLLAAGLYSKMDDWIINGIKFENQQVYSVVILKIACFFVFKFVKILLRSTN